MDKAIAFRKLNADEIEIRAARCAENGAQFLLYKDARVDMNVLDETVGAQNWQRQHDEHNGNLFCKVGIKFGDEWVWKEDAGAESNTEAEKGHASDSFKRACVNWGIGRELYTSPFIWIKNCTEPANSVLNTKAKWVLKKEANGLKVTKIGYDGNGKINELEISNGNGIVWSMRGNTPATAQATEERKDTPKQEKTRTDANTRACEVCGAFITDKVFKFSLDKYGRALCMNCQRNESTNR